MSISKTCIPNREVVIRREEPPWITSVIRKSIRQRKRAYRKAKRTGLDREWISFKLLRNRTTAIIKEAKDQQTKKLENDLLSGDKRSRSWWATLKCFICPSSSTSIPPLQMNDDIVSDESEKANLLNNFFRDQTLLDETSITLPELSQLQHMPLENSVSSAAEVSDVLKSLPIGKACGPDAINNKISL